MKNIKNWMYAFCGLLALSTIACQPKESSNTDSSQDSVQTETIKFPERAKAMNIYEVNIRQYTPEGTFNAFIPHIDRLHKMGVDILWIMPIQPIGVKNRKETENDLGSYYSISDYSAVNPEHGTLEDFQKLVATAHKNNMIVILDWVANHTAWDHYWIDTNPDFYTTDSLGNVIPPNPDWEDVADLNYDTPALRDSMMQEMKFWITEADIDGFRCDVANEVPTDFWKMVIPELEKEKDIFMLAEANVPELHDAGFDMTYAWEFHHVMNKIAIGEDNADSIDAYLEREYNKFDEEDFRMQFTTNHDENSWNGTVHERLGEGYKTFAVLAATLHGMPLIYSGQEAALNKRLSFFGKDSIDWSQIPLEDFYHQLLTLKSENEALWNGTFGVKPERINTNNNTENVYAFKRVKDTNEVVVILNLSKQSQTVTLDEASTSGTYQSLFQNKSMPIPTGAIELDPWEYQVYYKSEK